MINMTGILTRDKKENMRTSAEDMDEERRRDLSYLYLCHLEEAKKWMEACLRESLPPSIELEENLRNGVYLAKLGHFMAPNILPLNKIYDSEQRRYKAAGLQFRHTDNINYFLKCLEAERLPLTFLPETTDIYDKKNMPRLIYCIHALSKHLFKYGKAPPMPDLYGKVNFSEEEIDIVTKELQKHDIQMPAFQKIGGLLSNSTTTDTATLHDAVIAINQAVMDNDNGKILRKLQNKAMQLSNVEPAYIEKYSKVLAEAKATKTEASLNKSLNDSYVADEYDELLTQAEIQGHINYVNVSCALETIVSSLSSDNAKIIAALKAPVLSFKNIFSEDVEDYKEELMLMLDKFKWNDIYPSESIQYWTDMFQNAINKGNENAQRRRKRDKIIDRLNKALESADKKRFYEILQNPCLEISHCIDEFAVPLYYQEMKEDHIESEINISYDDIVVSLRILTAIAAITKAVDTENPNFVYEKLSNSDAPLTGLDEFNKVKYTQALTTARQAKLRASQECSILTYSDIQECIDLVNEQCNEDFEVIKIVQHINRAVAANDHESMMEAIKMITEKFNISTYPNDGPFYLKLLKKRLLEKKSDESELWLDDVKTVAETVTSEIEEMQNKITFLYDINMYVEKNNLKDTLDTLEMFDIPEKFKLTEECQKRCFLALQQLSRRKREMYNCPYVCYTTDKGNEIYINLKSTDYAWERPRNFAKTHYLTIDDVNETIKSIIAEKRQEDYMCDEKLLVKLQACIRGYLVRKRIVDKYAYFDDNLRKIIMIQAWWRGIRQRRQYRELLQKRKNMLLHQSKSLNARTNNKNKKTCHIKLNARTNDKNDRLSRYRRHEDEIIKIQALWRGRASRKAFRSLLRSEKPSFPVVRYFSTILGFSAEDYDKDLELQKLKHEVVQCIKHNQNLSEQLNNMFVKIGLLIQNRIVLQDVVAHGKNLDTLAKEKNTSKDQSLLNDVSMSQKGLKSLTREGRKMLEGYQHLFYALQTNPQYLSKLLYLPPSNKSNKLFLKNIILTLFNFGSNTREDYLLLKLFGCALREEIKCNCHQPSDVLTGKPLVREMVVNYAKQFNGQASLKQIVGPLIEKVLEEKELCIETNPVDIYKLWRNQLEMECGQSLDMPHTVSQEQALKHIQVQESLTRAINQLKKISLEFLNKITQCRDLIPYGMLYVSKVLYNTLMEKFPHAPEKDILKAVGNLIYYHFINAAIVAPDTFDIVTLPVDRTLSSCQRKNLASIAKVLQFSTSKKGFGEEAPHLECLNQFIIACHERFKDFFRYCCQVEDLEEHFDIHEFTEATLIQSPEICISLQEICEMHALLLNYEDQIAPDPSDPLHDLLDELGPAPTVASLLGISEAAYDANLARYSKQEVCLVLTNKFQVPRNDDANLSNLFVKAKELLVSVIPFLKSSTLVESLETTSSLMCVKLFDYSSVSPTVRESSSINDCKMQLRAYLNKLELEGWVSRVDDYQTIVTAIARDICNKSKYRVARDKELQTLRATKVRLDEKTRYYQEQVKFYNEYIKGCLQNLHSGKSSLRAYQATQKDEYTQCKLRSKMTVKYSAWKLQEKGVMKVDQSLSPTEMKNVIFEISPTEHSGVFAVRCKFMGVELEKLDISIQELLELQYEGRPYMDMFGRAQINVNLLLYLLNRKFYGKKS